VTDKYILDGAGNPVPCPDLFAWGRWMQTGDRRVAASRIRGLWVSTVFLGLDHNFGTGWQGPMQPVLFETMVFFRQGGWTDRHCTRADALAGHEYACRLIREDLGARPRGYSQSHWRKIWRTRWAP
jgi:hypothetical protein